MLNVKFITLGTLKEAYLRDAAAEYEKRLGGFCRFESFQLKEERLSDDPSDNEIKSALQKESEKILSLIPARAYVVAMCVEGKQLSSPELADKLDEISARTSDICFIIGSSFGLSDTVKQIIFQCFALFGDVGFGEYGASLLLKRCRVFVA